MMRTNISGKKKFVIICSLFAVLSIPLIYLKAIHTFVKNPFYIDIIKSAWQGAEYLGNEGVTRQNKKNNCGPAALKMVFDRLNVESTVKELELLSGMTQHGTSLVGLMKCVRLKGFNAEAWRLSFEDLKMHKDSAIAFINNNHYVVVDSITNDGEIIILDPAIGKLKLEEKEFKKMWKGVTLIID